MSLFVLRFIDATAMTTYVNDETIAQADIQRIVALDGGWFLFWWA